MARLAGRHSLHDVQSVPPVRPRAPPAAADLVAGAVHVSAPLAMGIGLYALFGKHSACAASVSAAPTALAWIRDVAKTTMPLPPSWLVQNVPDALWGYAVGAFVTAVWARETTWVHWLWTGVAFALVAGFEVGQRAGLVPGTFDPIDLAASICAFVVAVALGHVLRGERHAASDSHADEERPACAPS